MYTRVNHVGVLTRAVRNISRRKMRAFLVIVALGFSMAIMISIPSGIIANQAATQSITENYNTTISEMEEEINETATLIEVSASGGRSMFSSTPFNESSGGPSGMPPSGFGQEEVFMNETVCDEISTIEGVKDIVQFLETSSEDTTSETMDTPMGSFTVSRPIYTITGVLLSSAFIDEYSVLPTNITTGENLSEGDSGVLVMSLNLSEYYSVSVGDKVEVYGEYFKIVGIYDSTERTVYMNISDLQRITGNIGNISRLDVYAEDVSYVDSIAEVIEVAYSDLYITTYEDRLTRLENMQEMYETTLENAESTLSQTQTVAFEEILIAVVATSLIVLFMMLYSVRERTKEIGVLKAIGFSNWSVMSQFMLEGILLSVMAGGVGAVIGIVGAPVISSLLLPSANSVNLFSSQQQGFSGQGVNFQTALSQSVAATADSQMILLVFGVVILLGAIGSLYPAWRASRTSPMEALRYE
jgi:putative ABC transport system permease protein